MDLQTRAHNILKSWLRANRIRFTTNNQTLQAGHLTINFSNETNESTDRMDLDVRLFDTKQHPEMEKTLQRLAAKLNITKPTKFRTTTLHRRNYKTDYEGSYLRHVEFSRTVNPPDEVIQKYLPIVKKMANIAYRRYHFMVSSMGFEREDLLDIGLVHLTTFLHNFEDSTNIERTEAYLRHYLNQRFAEWNKISRNKLENSNCPTMLVEADERLAEIINPEEEYDNQKFGLRYPDGSIHFARLIKHMATAKLEVDGNILSKGEISKLSDGIDQGSIKIDFSIARRPRLPNKDLDSLPDILQCAHCKQELPKGKIGTHRVMTKSGPKIRRQSYCCDCRNGVRNK